MPDQDLVEFRAAVVAALGSGSGDTPPPPALWHRLGSSGVIAAVYRGGDDRHRPAPARFGILLEELDRRFPVGLVLSVCVPVATVVPLLSDAGRDHSGTAAAVVEALLRGETTVALAVTDSAAAGSELLDARTEVRIGPSTEPVTVTGGKDWITNAQHCDHALVLGRHRDARHFTSFRWVLVPATAAGVSVVPAGDGLFAGAGLGHLRFDGVALGRERLVGPPGRALAGFARHIGTERLAGALWARAMCRRVLADTHRWLADRPLDGGSLWDNAAIRERFARCLVELATIEAHCIAYTSGDGEPPPSAGMVLKAAVGERVERILGECANLRGADAFRAGGEANLRAAAAMFGIAGGATGAMLAGVADYANDLLRTAQ